MTAPPVLILRPQPAADRSAERLRKKGFDAIVLPLFETRAVDWRAPDPADYDALIVCSANALRHGGLEQQKLTGLPVYAVGEATAHAASAAGFVVADTGNGGIAGLEPLLRRDGRRKVLRLAARENTAFAPAGIEVDSRIVYAAEALDVAPRRLAALPSGTVAMLYSGRAARRFAALVDAGGQGRTHFSLLAIGPAVAQAAGAGWARCLIAATPDERAMLSALEKSLES